MYRNALFFADRLRSCIWALLPDASGIPKKGSVVPFAGMAKRATDLEVTQQGDLLYIDQGADTVQRIRYTLANHAPKAVATANVTSGVAPLAVTFNGSGSSDSDGNAITYAWDLDGDNLLDDSTAAKPTFNYTTPGTYTVTLKVTDSEGAFSTSDGDDHRQAPDAGPDPDPDPTPIRLRRRRRSRHRRRSTQHRSRHGRAGDGRQGTEAGAHGRPHAARARQALDRGSRWLPVRVHAEGHGDGVAAGRQQVAQAAGNLARGGKRQGRRRCASSCPRRRCVPYGVLCAAARRCPRP